MSELLTPGGDWQRLPAVAAKAKRLAAFVINGVLFCAAAVATGIFWSWTVAAGIAAFGLGWTIWRVVRAGRWIASFGFRERERDLLITHGLWFKQLTAIPYGRMLSVEVESGPIDRYWDLAEVSLITASIESNATIPALPSADAARLRDRLITAGEAQALPL